MITDEEKDKENQKTSDIDKVLDDLISGAKYRIDSFKEKTDSMLDNVEKGIDHLEKGMKKSEGILEKAENKASDKLDEFVVSYVSDLDASDNKE